MFTLEMLQKIDFFNKRASVLQDKEKFEIEDVLLPRPMVTAKEGELQLIIKTNSKFDFEQYGQFSEKLNKVFGEKITISLFEEENLKGAIEAGVGMTSLYRTFLQSAIPISALNENSSLEDQWRIQESRSAALSSGSLLMSWPKASVKASSVNVDREKHEHEKKTNGIPSKKDIF